jgi:succinate-semialdehyde dehydrogenase/glutarate-semialdehyde dehydrogenase
VISTINPATGKTERTFEQLDAVGLEERIESSWRAFGSYRRSSPAERSTWTRRVAEVLERDSVAIATTMTTEMGKTLLSAKAEVAKCAAVCRFYADRGEEFLADEPVDPRRVGASRAFARYEPLGPVLAVMPWNFPLWQVMRFAAPALMAGNPGLLKHASNVPQTALALERVFLEAGLPEGVFQALLIGSDRVEGVLADARVVAATLTGSAAAGRAVAAAAGRNLKKVVLELGGSDPFIVLPTADLGLAARVASVARCQNNGQSCIAAKRFIVHEDVADRFESLFVDEMDGLKVGDPMKETTDVGPLATEAGLEELETLVQDGVAKGAEVLCGGSRIESPGWYFPPTVIRGITPAMRMFTEEVFGPVAQLYRVGSMGEAIALANATSFGLGSNVWSNDPHEQEQAIDGLRAGAVFINGMTTSFPDLPFGGVKESGFGRELGRQGIREFCNLKTVWMDSEVAP